MLIEQITDYLTLDDEIKKIKAESVRIKLYKTLLRLKTAKYSKELI